MGPSRASPYPLLVTTVQVRRVIPLTPRTLAGHRPAAPPARPRARRGRKGARMERAPLVTVVGPTPCGQPGLALAVGAGLGGEVGNADALQLYGGLDIGTAMLGPEQREGTAHPQLDVLEVTPQARVSAYQQAAREDIGA